MEGEGVHADERCVRGLGTIVDMGGGGKADRISERYKSLLFSLFFFVACRWNVALMQGWWRHMEKGFGFRLAISHLAGQRDD